MAEQQEVRVLTVRQPWAAAIIHGGKDVENRPRNIAGGYRGPVAIHAGLAIDRDAWDDLEAGWSLAPGAPRLAGPAIDALAHRGAILGVVDLVDVHPAADCIAQDSDGRHTSDWYHCSPWGQEGQQHLVLVDPRPLAAPIPYRGALGLRKLPADVAAAVLAPTFPAIGATVTRETSAGGGHRQPVLWEGTVTKHLRTKARVHWTLRNGQRTSAVLDHYPHEIQEQP